jgi:hypothetical protein
MMGVVVMGRLGLGGRVIDGVGLTRRSASVCLFQFPYANLPMFGIWTYHLRVRCNCELGQGEKVELWGVREPFIDSFLSTIVTFYKIQGQEIGPKVSTLTESHYHPIPDSTESV